MSRIYTARLWVVADAPAGTVSANVGTPGNTIVVRNIDVYWPHGPYIMPGGFELVDSTAAILLRVVKPKVRPQEHYQWEGRQVLLPDRLLQMTTLEDGWHWWITGYNLTPSPVPVV
jgi:hypothetical protein